MNIQPPNSIPMDFDFPSPEQDTPLQKNSASAPQWLEAGAALIDPDGLIIEINHALAAWLNCKVPDAIGRSFPELLGEWFPNWNAIHGEMTQNSAFFQQRVIASVDGELQQWFSLEVVRHPQGWFIRLNSVLPPAEKLAEASWDEHLRTDQSRREMFVRLLRSEAQLDSLIHRWPGVIFSQRADFSFQFVSPQIEQLTGVPIDEWKQHPQRFWQVVHEADVDELKQQIRNATSFSKGVTTTYRIQHLISGKVAYILEHRQAVATKGGLLLGYEGIWLDVTRQTIAEKRLSTAAWKETLALLTMGLAHDFSNVMAGIHSLSESYLSQIDGRHPFFEGLQLIKKNSMQASQLVHRIINLHHGKTGERQYHDLNEVVKDILDLVRKILPRRIEVKIDLAPHSFPVYVDVFEFRQVIINLILNAADAMPDRGVITFATALHQEFPALAFVQGAPPRLPAICLSISDTGCGIKPHHLPLVFDPFFTTKSANKGSGLGLYNARLFVEKHHGAISVDSGEGQGTTFSLWLPQSDFTEAERTIVSQPIRRRSLLLLGVAGQALESTVEFLRTAGYHVVVAYSVQQASDLMTAREYPYEGLMAVLEGKEVGISSLFAAARDGKPPLKTILEIVGLNEDELETHLLSRTDLIISSDMPQSAVTDKLNMLWQKERTRGT